MSPQNNQRYAQLATAINTAIWLLGLAILFYTGSFWPGILILVGVSGLVTAGLRVIFPDLPIDDPSSPHDDDRHGEQRSPSEPPSPARPALPATCRHCSAVVNPAGVDWSDAHHPRCEYCHQPLLG